VLSTARAREPGSADSPSSDVSNAVIVSLVAHSAGTVRFRRVAVSLKQRLAIESRQNEMELTFAVLRRSSQ
jgi:hypothetical protein